MKKRSPLPARAKKTVSAALFLLCFIAFPAFSFLGEGCFPLNMAAYGSNLQESPGSNTHRSVTRESASSRGRAMEIWKQAAALQIERKYEEALEKYREGLGYAEDARVREHVDMLEWFLFRHDPEERNRLEAAREQAMAIWKYAAALQQAREYWEALERYREGLAIFENRRVREHVEKLELFIRRLLSLGGVEIRVQERKQGPLILKS
ncbi:MAG: hypothetical protein PHI81_00875 [Synergistaceae bacterium]|uniref:hypothetical protein n=1 Tax=Aminivibrio sp. TaxID=1872489 RepID=UPI002A1C690B|nr:hypothetical protein [Synergistaceae bacterium]MDD3390388.1 hypothetical protein [Synergistaceae bacterium]MDD3688570.1 hypothetical protein [Synergistaceae bacterium]MDD4020229.1 hypothetical protein [Synergistaceae bacterium]NCC67805.1 hypothetical protein [Clostridia bacterium]